MSSISLFDGTLYRDMFADPEMGRIFSEDEELRCLVDVEKAVALAQGEVGIIPVDTATAIAASLDAATIDRNLLHEDILDVGRPIAGLVKQLVTQVDPKHASWVHYGVTTYDTIDTAKALQIRNAIERLSQMVRDYRDRLTDLAADHRDTPMMGRTNNLHAQPLTFGLKLAAWIEELMRHEDRLQALKGRVLVVQFGGAVGTLASLEPHGLAFRKAVAERLGLGAIHSNWHNARDGVAEIGGVLANLCASLARNAQIINALSGTDIGEVSEVGKQGRGRSTSMPHKRNPRAAEFAEATARLGRQRANGLVDVMGQEHERCGGTYICEWMMMPEAFLLSSGALHWAIDLIDRLEIHPGVMRANIDTMGALALSERFTLALSKHVSKLEARKMMDRAVTEAFTSGTPLPDVMAIDPDISAHLSADDITALADPETYVGASAQMVDAVVGQSRLRSGAAT